jgi:DHA1 family bicyclomycin/chloramphenicol resistance-like MFS transporter
MAQRFPDRYSPPHIMTLVLATATGALAMNVFVPSLPGMASYFDADYRVAQLAVSLYLAATAVLQLVIGPASDRFGRRPVMLACFAVFLVGTVAAIYAPTIEVLLICRVLQAFAVAGMVLARAIVRDTVGPDEAASRIGYITMGMALAPMLGPVIGGFLDELYGWQATFMLTLLVGSAAFAVIFFDLGETNGNTTPSLTAQFKAYPELARCRRFWGYAVAAAFSSGTFFAFLGGGPYVASEILQLRPSEYGLYFAVLSGGYMFGSYLSGRIARHVGINRMMLFGNIVTFSSMLVALALFGGGFEHAISLFGPAAFMGMGNGMTLPSASSGVVSVRPRLAGSASGLGGTLQIGGGAALAILAGSLLSPESGAMPLLWVMFASAFCAVIATLYVIHIAREAGELQETV